jgi:hypothetical protein
MPEILTESFCERCGTRYTFESATPRGARLKGIKTMSRGLRNFVMSDDTSMDEAMAAARNETDREQTSQQLDAFHKTFNFCMSCRQYTCSNCWNEPEGRCLSCAPNLGADILQAPFPNLGAGGAMTLTDAEAVGLKDRNGHDEPSQLEPMAWPTSDLMQEAERAADVPPLATGGLSPDADEPDGIDFAARLEALAGPTSVAEAPAESAAIVESPVVEPLVVDAAPMVDAAPVAEPPVIDVQAEPEPVVAATAEPAPEPVEPPSEEEIAAILAELAHSEDGTAPAAAPQPGDDRAVAAAANTSELFRKFRPGQNLDDEIAAFERAQAEAKATVDADAVTGPIAAEPVAPVVPEPVVPEPEPVAAAAPEPEPEPVAAMPEPEPAPEPVAAMPEPEPEPVAAAPEPEPEPVAEPEPVPWPVAAEPGPAPEPRVDVVPQPTWQIVAPEAPTADGLPSPSVPPAGVPADAIAASADPQWPAQPEWPAPQASAGLPYLGRPAAATGGIEALWAASAQEVSDPAAGQGVKIASGVQPCVSCGLSLSANARFCRRCGTRQG